MVDFYALVSDGFLIKDGELCDKYGNKLYVRISVPQWSSQSKYVFDDYSLSEYSIEKSVWGSSWYLKRGYQEVCELEHLGGLNFKTRYL